jgi:hypothetical protein
MKGEGVIMETPNASDKGVLFFDDNVTESWLEIVLEKVAKTSPKLRAFDVVPEGDVVNLSASITRDKVIEKSDHPGIWMLSFAVQDHDGNAASFAVRFHVTALSAEALLPLLSTGQQAAGQRRRQQYTPAPAAFVSPSAKAKVAISNVGSEAPGAEFMLLCPPVEGGVRKLIAPWQ